MLYNYVLSSAAFCLLSRVLAVFHELLLRTAAQLLSPSLQVLLVSAWALSTGRTGDIPLLGQGFCDQQRGSSVGQAGQSAARTGLSGFCVPGMPGTQLGGQWRRGREIHSRSAGARL
ncbi:hypothetical protein GE09DRAFT_1127927, partial [Coniochaeta sp. 2T2.1]